MLFISRRRPALANSCWIWVGGAYTTLQVLQVTCTVITESGVLFRSERESREGRPDQQTSETPLPLNRRFSFFSPMLLSSEFGP